MMTIEQTNKQTTLFHSNMPGVRIEEVSCIASVFRTLCTRSIKVKVLNKSDNDILVFIYDDNCKVFVNMQFALSSQHTKNIKLSNVPYGLVACIYDLNTKCFLGMACCFRICDINKIIFG